MARVYLDHAATTPMRPAACEAVLEGMARWANPSSPHAEGRAARAAMEGARRRIKAALGWEHELVFTSGASEAVALAIGRQARPRPVLAGATEHLAVLRACPEDATTIPVGADGRIDAAALDGLLRHRPGALVAVQHVNPETGVIQPLAALAERIRQAAGILLADCAQSAGKRPLPPADLLAISAHKLGGPPGVGAMLVRDRSLITARGGAQEGGYRAGTQNLPAILGFAAALEEDASDMRALHPELRASLDDAVAALGGTVVAGSSERLPAIASYRFPGIAAAALLIRLDLAGFAVSAGSACSSGSIHASHVMRAMSLDEAAAREVIRVSLGWTTTRDDVARFADALGRIVPPVAARAA